VQAVLFFDGGTNGILNRGGLKLDPLALDTQGGTCTTIPLSLACAFPTAKISTALPIAPGTNFRLRGSTGIEFVVRLPIAECGTRDAGPKDVPRSALCVPHSRRVLVVDDNRDAAESLAMMLRLDGHEVQVAHDGPAALEAARAFGPEVVLMDIGLPRMSGHEVAARLSQQPHDGERLLVAMTGYGQDEDRRRSREAGFDHHLVKPVDPQTLRDLLA